MMCLFLGVSIVLVGDVIGVFYFIDKEIGFEFIVVDEVVVVLLVSHAVIVID